MPRNIIGGKGAKKGKNACSVSKEIPLKTEGLEYGRTVKTLGNRRFMVMCEDGVERLCHVRGKMRRRVWVVLGDYVLVGLRDYQDKKGDIIHKYTANQTGKLIKSGLIKAPTDNYTYEPDVDDDVDTYIKETINYDDLYDDISCSSDDISCSSGDCNSLNSL